MKNNKKEKGGNKTKKKAERKNERKKKRQKTKQGNQKGKKNFFFLKITRVPSMFSIKKMLEKEVLAEGS